MSICSQHHGKDLLVSSQLWSLVELSHSHAVGPSRLPLVSCVSLEGELNDLTFEPHLQDTLASPPQSLNLKGVHDKGALYVSANQAGESILF